MQSGRISRHTPGNPPQFQDAVPDVAIFGQMRRRRGFAGGGHHLVERAPMGKLRVKLPAKFTRPAGARIEAFHYGWIDVFHEAFLLGDVRAALAAM